MNKLFQPLILPQMKSNVSPAGNEAEGCVFDDEQKRIFISREGSNGILKAYDAETLS